MHMEQRVAPRQLRKDRRQNRRAEGQRRCNAQPAAQVPGGQDRLPRDIDFGADPSGVVTERGAGLRQRGAASCPCNKLDAQFSL